MRLWQETLSEYEGDNCLQNVLNITLYMHTEYYP